MLFAYWTMRCVHEALFDFHCRKQTVAH
eukprot:COSAG06_NODE_2103_length_7590_cov_3.824723_1_plen_27_part_10